MSTKSIFRIALAFAAIQFACAQPVEKIALQFIAFPKQADLKPIELLVGENQTIPIDIPGNELSPVYTVTRPPSITVGITTRNEKGEPVFQPYGSAPSIASPKQIIVLLRKGEKDSDGFLVIPIDGSLNDFAGGTYFFLNVSKLNIGGLIGDQKFVLKPGQRKLVKPTAGFPGGGCQVTLAYQKDEADLEVKKFYDTRWSVNKRYRTLVFFYQDPENGGLGVAPIVNIL